MSGRKQNRVKRASRKRAQSKRARNSLRSVAVSTIENNVIPSLRTPSKALGPLRNKQKVTLVYSEPFAIDASTSASSRVYAMNGLFQPNLGVSAGQPRGWDELMTMYTSAVVIGARATVTYANSSTSVAQNLTLSIRDTATAVTNRNDVMEYRYIKHAVLGQIDAGSSTGSLDISVNPNKFLGVSSPLSSGLVKNTVATNPTSTVLLHVNRSAQNASADPGPVYCVVRIEYDVILLEPKQPAAS